MAECQVYKQRDSKDGGEQMKDKSQKIKKIDIEKLKKIFIRAIKAHDGVTYETQYDIGFQRGIEHGYYLLKMAAGEIKEVRK